MAFINESEEFIMSNIFDSMDRDFLFKQYEDLKEQLQKALDDTDVSATRISNLVFLIKCKKKELCEILDDAIEKDLYTTDGRIGYLMASEDERKYMNPDGSANLVAISELCNKIDRDCGVTK